MRLAKATRQNPRKLAEALLSALPANPALAKVEIAGAGFINFFLKENAYHAEIGRVLAQGADYGKSQFGGGRSVLVEFVSANPTGPLHVGHGRHAAFGASLANLLEAVGYRVAREYYVNDAGRQMEILAASTWLRYLERCGERLTFPANGYRGGYIIAIAEELYAAQGTALAPLRRRGLQGLAARRTARRRQGPLHRCADRSRPDALRAMRLFAACWIWRSAASSPISAKTWRSSA